MLARLEDLLPDAQARRRRMMDALSPLERGLRERRYEKASQACAQVLNGIGINDSEQHAVPLDDIGPIWTRYLARLRESSDATERWPTDEGAAVQRRVEQIADALGDQPVVWLSLFDSEPVGIEAPAGSLLRAALP